MALREAAVRLAAVSATPRLDAELLMAHAAGVSRERLLIGLREMTAPDGFAQLIERRMTHEPVAYITGTRDLWTISLKVGPGVLIPRADSETLIEAAIEYCGAAGPKRVLDLGCGPGTLLLAALDQWPQATGLGLERSAIARDFARQNVAALGMGDRAEIMAGDWTTPGWADALGRFDLILANPPYVETGAALMDEVGMHEPAEALFAGDEGLDDYRILVPHLPGLMSDHGVAILEIGAAQYQAVARIGLDAGLAGECRRDLGGNDRALILQR